MERKIGSVSFFMAMIFLLVMSVLSTTIISARVHGAKAIVSTSVSASVDSVFAKFDSDLFEKFGVLFFRVDEDGIEETVEKYLNKNVNTEYGSDLFGIGIQAVNVDEIKYATNYGGLLFMDQVVDYEKYAKPIDLAADFLGIGGSKEQQKIMNDTMDAMISITDEMELIRESMKNLVQYTNGVNFTEQGLSEVPEKYFINMFKTEDDLSFGLLPSVSNRIDVFALLEEAINYCNLGNVNEAKKITDKIKTSIKNVLRLPDSLDINLEYGNACIDLLSQTAANMENVLNENEGILGKDLTSELIKNFSKLEQYSDTIRDNFCDLNKFEVSINKDINILSKVKIILDQEVTEKNLRAVYDLFLDYDTSGFNFNYGYFEVKEKSKSNIFKTLKKYYEQGVLGLVIPDDRKLSLRTVPQYKNQVDAACAINTDYYMGNCDSVTRTEKKIIFNEYVMDNFNNFLSNSNGPAVDYEVEYILNGCGSDFENLYETVKKIALIRSVVNLVYLLTDNDKKEEALGLAVSIIGWAESEALNEILKYIILYIWSYAEGLLEAKALLMGRKVNIFKTEKNWMLEFSDFISLNFTVDEEKTKSGLGYETYLRALLMLEDEGIKSVNTMKLMELWKIANGDKEFRFKDCVYSFTGDVVYKINGIKREYSYGFAQTY